MPAPRAEDPLEIVVNRADRRREYIADYETLLSGPTLEKVKDPARVVDVTGRGAQHQKPTSAQLFSHRDAGGLGGGGRPGGGGRRRGRG